MVLLLILLSLSFNNTSFLIEISLLNNGIKINYNIRF